jgi:pimeloyl-ACP methyl ester carboxylesterase
MPNSMLRTAMLTAALLAYPPSFAVVSESSSSTQALQTVQGGSYRLRVHVFQGEQLSEHPVLLVVLHGDLGTDYINLFASQAARNRDVVAVTLLRPGYSDRQGNISEGSKGLATGDNYDATNTDAVAAAVLGLKEQFHARKVVLAGHSGGAAVSANILGRHPDVADAALLVSCPCNVPVWRKHMLEKTHIADFAGTIRTLSPIDLVAVLSDQVQVMMLVGSDDDIAPPNISESYQAASVKFHKHVQLKQIPGAAHDMFLDPVVQTYLQPLLQ